MSKKKYNKPPIVECLIELFIPPQQWTEELIDKLYSQDFKEQYPIKRTMSDNILEFMIDDKGKLHQSFSGISRYRFLKSDNSSMIQFSNNLCVFNQLLPYPESFANVLNKAEKVLKHYLFIMNPEKVEHLGVRYINKIKLPHKDYKLKEYLNLYPEFQALANSQSTNFALQLSIPGQKNENIIVSLTYNGINELEQPIYTLDLYAKKIEQIEVKFNEIKGWVCKAQETLEYLFESSITDKARDLFEVIKK